MACRALGVGGGLGSLRGRLAHFACFFVFSAVKNEFSKGGGGNAQTQFFFLFFSWLSSFNPLAPVSAMASADASDRASDAVDFLQSLGCV